MKTRQQRLTEERAGHPPSPPQSLPINQPGPRRARSKTPSATVAAGSVVPAPQSAALGESQALLCIWMDVDPEHSVQPVNESTHQVAFDSSLLNKRKRWGDPFDTPGTDARGHGRGATDIYEGPEEGSMTEEQQVKRRRTDQSEGLASQVAGNPTVPRPSAVRWQGGNIFAEDQAAREAASTGQQFQPKTPIPITNRTGTFKVPSPGDSDWGDSESDEDEGDNASLEGIAPSHANKGGLVVGSPSKQRQTLRPSESEALRKARE